MKNIDERIEELLGQLGKTKEDLARELEDLQKWLKSTKYNGAEGVVSLEYMFYKKEMFRNRVNDVANYASEMNIRLTDEEIKEVATRFLNKYDCNATENDQIEYLIEKIVTEREK